jgi:hypothetical protein
MNTQRLYKQRLFHLLGNRYVGGPQLLTDAEFEQLIRKLLDDTHAYVSCEPTYLFISLTHPVVAEVVGMYMDTHYMLISNWTRLRTWEDFIRLVRRRWVVG